MLSLVILLPRSMQEEAGYHRPANIFVRQAYQVTSAGAAAAGNGQAHNAASYRAATTVAAPLEVSGPWAILGERLNLEKDEVRELIANNAARQEEEAEMAQGVAYDLAPLIAPEQEGRGRAF
ncbi:hypothetical protein QFC19_001227 [Naganishia cerealis]|uniref:Uncharacterized protein n=1 Tax=Naganishia cerealis TaxID=610337 RepID=A0ACC2WI76_9TREE|nr:hypothetical protein QFC19_001227 [Naganishia cerealis]